MQFKLTVFICLIYLCASTFEIKLKETFIYDAFILYTTLERATFCWTMGTMSKQHKNENIKFETGNPQSWNLFCELKEIKICFCLELYIHMPKKFMHPYLYKLNYICWSKNLLKAKNTEIANNLKCRQYRFYII